MKTIVHLVIALLVGAIGSPALAQFTADAAIAKTERILKNFQDGQTGEIAKEFNAQMTAALPEAAVQPVWPATVAKFGPLQGIKERRQGQFKGRQAVELFLALEKETILMRAVFDEDGKVAGLVFQPVSMSVLPPAK